MMRFRATLRTRFVGAVFLLAALICGGFFYAVYYFVEVLEACALRFGMGGVGQAVGETDLRAWSEN